MEAVREHGARRLEGERALAMTDVELHAALAGGQHRRFDLALRGAGGIREWAEGVGEHIARPQHVEHFLIGGRRVVDVAHER